MKNLVNLLLAFSLMAVISSCTKDTTGNTHESSDWTQLGGAFDSQIYNVVAAEDGAVYMSGGDLWNISVWNGTAWSRLGDQANSPFTAGLYWPITVDEAGNVYAVGRIAVPQANSEYHVAKWVKATHTWINLTGGGPLFDNGIHSMATDAQGNLYVAGNVAFLPQPEAGNYMYKWNGSSWTMMGGTKLPRSEYVKMHVDNSGNLLASFYNDSISACVSKWNGSGWDELSGKNKTQFGTGQIFCLNSDSKGNVYAGGFYIKNDSAYNIFKWTKSTNTWSPLYTYGSSLAVNSIAFDSGDSLYVAGRFVNTDNKMYVAQYQGNKWADYGKLNANNTINSICFDAKGNMYAGGEFTNGDGRYYVGVRGER